MTGKAWGYLIASCVIGALSATAATVPGMPGLASWGLGAATGGITAYLGWIRHMTETRCEPPPELRGVDGWHWVRWHEYGPGNEFIAGWDADSAPYGCWDIDSAHINRDDGRKYIYVAPATPPDVVARLVEALEGLMHWHPAPNVIRRMGLKPEPAEAAYEAACAALAAYREAGR